jgi:four helix bundle protein
VSCAPSTSAAAGSGLPGPSSPLGQEAAASAAVAVSAPEDAAIDQVQLDAAKLHCYQVALDLHGHCAALVSPLTRVLRDQLERASLSVVLNTAEAAGRRSRRDKARFYAIARGSATEVAALLDVLALRRLVSPAAIRASRCLAIRVVQMLSKIDKRLLG